MPTNDDYLRIIRQRETQAAAQKGQDAATDTVYLETEAPRFLARRAANSYSGLTSLKLWQQITREEGRGRNKRVTRTREERGEIACYILASRESHDDLGENKVQNMALLLPDGGYALYSATDTGAGYWRVSAQEIVSNGFGRVVRDSLSKS